MAVEKETINEIEKKKFYLSGSVEFQLRPDLSGE